MDSNFAISTTCTCGSQFDCEGQYAFERIEKLFIIWLKLHADCVKNEQVYRMPLFIENVEVTNGKVKF